jgi:hypothetical protein
MVYIPNRRNRAPIGRASFRTARSHSVSAARRFGPVPGTDEILFLPLGGCSRIGMNMAFYGHAGKWLIVDAGVAFLGDEAPGIEAINLNPAVGRDGCHRPVANFNFCGFTSLRHQAGTRRGGGRKGWPLR